MSTYSGRNARVTVNASETEKIVGEMFDWNIDASAESIDTTIFGDGWGKSDVGMKKWAGSMSGHCDPEDIDGQEVLETAFLDGSILDDIRFYIKHSEVSQEKIHYVHPDTASDPNAGVRITGFNRNVDKSGVVMLTVTFEGCGPLKTTEETVT